MRLTVLDDNFEPIGEVPLFRTLLWARRYEKLGCYELYASKDYFELFNTGRYLYRNDADELGIIDDVNYSQDDKGSREAYAKGNFAEALLGERVIQPKITLTGNMETCMRRLVTTYAISPSNADRIIEHLRLGDLAGITQTMDIQVTGANLSDKLYDIGNTVGISHRVRFDYLTGELIFEVWSGKDRRDSQRENSWAIFSNSFYNIRNVVYNRSSVNYRNFAYVAGAGEGNDRVVVEVDLREPGEKRKEIYVDARDLQQQDENGNTIPLATYKAQLVQRGKEKLAEYRKVETVNSGVDSLANLVYKTDYDLGDYCTYINTEIGIATDKRITEIMEVYEGGSMELTVTFGTDEVSSVQQLIKREV